MCSPTTSLEIIACGRLPPDKLHFNPGNGDRVICGASIPQKRCCILVIFGWKKRTQANKNMGTRLRAVVLDVLDLVQILKIEPWTPTVYMLKRFSTSQQNVAMSMLSIHVEFIQETIQSDIFINVKLTDIDCHSIRWAYV